VPKKLVKALGRRFDRRAERRPPPCRLRPASFVGGRDPDRPWPEVLIDRHQLCRRQSAAHRDLYLADRLDHRPRGAGNGVLHHLRRDRPRPAPDQTRACRITPRTCSSSITAVLSEVSPPDRAVAVRGRPPSPAAIPYKTTLAVLEIHVAGVSWCRSCSCLDPQGVGLLLAIPKGGVVDRYPRNHDQDHLRTACAGPRFAQNWALRQKYARSSAACFCYGGLLLVFSELDRGGHRIDHRP